MRLPRRCLTAVVAAGLLGACTSASPSGPTGVAGVSPATPASTYVALGDSVAAGVGAERPSTGGYVPVLADLLRARAGCDGDDCLRVSRFAASGATTATVRQQQLPALRALLARTPAPPPVRLVTLTVGGNDVFGPVLRSCAPAPTSPVCATSAARAVTAAGRGMDAALDALDAAVPEATVAVMAYYDPLPGCRLAPLSPLAVQVLEGEGGRDGLNDVLRAAAAEHGAVVVETRALLADRADLVGGDDCLHPSGQGHREIAAAFDAAVGARVTAP